MTQTEALQAIVDKLAHMRLDDAEYRPGNPVGGFEAYQQRMRAIVRTAHDVYRVANSALKDADPVALPPEEGA